MASLYKQRKSPYWWLKCRDTRPDSPTIGRVIRFSTGLRIGIGPDTRAARELRAQYTLAESKFSTANPQEPWAHWVPSYLALYCKSPETLKRYSTIWRNLSLFLEEKEIHLPRQLTRTRCLEYMTWRMRPNRAKGLYRAVHNTAHLELKILSLIMAEAVRRNFTPFNPCRDLGIKRHSRGREKPEFTDAHLDTIWTAIQTEKPESARQFLANSFLIALYQGCRLNETYLNPQTDVDLAPGIIRFRIKGGREHTAPLHPTLIPLFEQLKLQGAQVTYERPPNPSRKWFDFLKRIGLRKVLPGACFHCLRVTAVTHLARSRSVSESQAMRFIGHASTTVHRQYQRLRAEDLSACMKALDFDAGKHPAPETADAPATMSAPATRKCSATPQAPSHA